MDGPNVTCLFRLVSRAMQPLGPEGGAVRRAHWSSWPSHTVASTPVTVLDRQGNNLSNPLFLQERLSRWSSLEETSVPSFQVADRPWRVSSLHVWIRELSLSFYPATFGRSLQRSFPKRYSPTTSGVKGTEGTKSFGNQTNYLGPLPLWRSLPFSLETVPPKGNESMVPSPPSCIKRFL